jgi:hypothetical protein
VSSALDLAGEPGVVVRHLLRGERAAEFIYVGFSESGRLQRLGVDRDLSAVVGRDGSGRPRGTNLSTV